jgi:hypothetical protein
MTRGQFLKGCASGLCSCAGVALVPLEAAGAQSDSKVEACQVRFAKLVGILNQNLDPAERKKIFETLGRECARQYHDLIDKYKGDVKGFLAMGQTQWMEKAEYDEQAGTIRIVDKGPNCSCPLVKPGMTPPEFCDCTLGWQKEAYSTMLQRPVEAELEESILRGGRRCVFRIRIA